MCVCVFLGSVQLYIVEKRKKYYELTLRLLHDFFVYLKWLEMMPMDRNVLSGKCICSMAHSLEIISDFNNIGKRITYLTCHSNSIRLLYIVVL